jgi:hypothetical protein
LIWSGFSDGKAGSREERKLTLLICKAVVQLRR